jgi:hypothetical protein
VRCRLLRVCAVGAGVRLPMNAAAAAAAAKVLLH